MLATESLFTIKMLRYINMKTSIEQCISPEQEVSLSLSLSLSHTHTHTHTSGYCICRRYCFAHLIAVPLLNLPHSRQCFSAQQIENYFTCMQTARLRPSPHHLISPAHQSVDQQGRGPSRPKGRQILTSGCLMLEATSAARSPRPQLTNNQLCLPPAPSLLHSSTGNCD